MEWGQTLTTIGTIGGGLLTTVLWLSRQHRESINMMRLDQQRLEDRHREDIAKMDDKIDKMDAKWERLFEKFLELMPRK